MIPSPTMFAFSERALEQSKNAFHCTMDIENQDYYPSASYYDASMHLKACYAVLAQFIRCILNILCAIGCVINTLIQMCREENPEEPGSSEENIDKTVFDNGWAAIKNHLVAALTDLGNIIVTFGNLFCRTVWSMVQGYDATQFEDEDPEASAEPKKDNRGYTKENYQTAAERESDRLLDLSCFYPF